LPRILGDFDIFDDDDGYLRHFGSGGFHDRPDGRSVVLEELVAEVAAEADYEPPRAVCLVRPAQTRPAA
jgi:hypothetical protein